MRPSVPFAALLFVVSAPGLASAGSLHLESRQQTETGVLAERYANIIRRYAPDPSRSAADIASWNTEDVRKAVQRVAGILEAVKRAFAALAELDAKQRSGADETYESRRAALVDRLERTYDALYTGEVNQRVKTRETAVSRGALDARSALETDSWRRGLPDSLVSYVRGAIGLHTSVAAKGWRDGAALTVVSHIEFARAYLPNLLVPFDPDYGRLWCRAGGALLTASDRHGTALAHFDGCLAWYPRDAWLLLGRGSTVESATTLMNGLAPGASLADWPERLRGVPDSMSQAFVDFETALLEAPDLAEARIRLARLRLSRGDWDAAALELEAASKTELPPVLAYWSSLLLGAIEERRGRHQEAAGHYRQALTRYTGAQTAAIALSRVLAERLGSHEEASALLRKQIRPIASRPFSSDPWCPTV